MDRLRAAGEFSPPTARDIEQVLSRGVALKRGRVFMDLWDVDEFFPCRACRAARIERLARMNLEQKQLPPIPCRCKDAASCV
jgi:hypothetical protein